MQIIIINGAPSLDKTIMSNKLHEYYKSPRIKDEEQMTFETLVIETQNHVKRGFENIVLSNTDDNHMWDIPNVFKNCDYIVFTLFTENDEGIMFRPVLMNEYQIKIERQTPDEIVQNIIEIIDSYKPCVEILKSVLTKMLGKNIIDVDYQTTKLLGGAVGKTQLITGVAGTVDGEKLPYKVVLKIQNKWERYNDPESWRREYDLYVSKFNKLFNESFRFAECYHAEMNDNETQTQLWIEYINGVSGDDLTVDMLEKASEEIGRFQGQLYNENPDILKTISCFTENLSEKYREKLPVVLCHRDFKATNILYSDNKIIPIDWDCAGWGYMGEDIANLATSEKEPKYSAEYFRRFISAYFRGITEYTEIKNEWETFIKNMIL